MKKITEENIRISKESPKKIEELYSFDIFDTLITRKTATPTGIFALMQKELETNEKYETIPLYLRNNFYYSRVDAEKYARPLYFKKFGNREISIYDIYDCLSMNYSLSEEEIKLLMDLELRLEAENAVPIWENLNKLINLYNENKKVILISDMYLEEWMIKDLLRPFIKFIDKIEIFVSQKIKLNKGGGWIYKYIRDFYNIDYKKWHHIGDNQISDVNMALSRGIKAIKFKFPQMETYEQNVFGGHLYNPTYQKFVGEVRNLRMIKPCNNKKRIGISFAGPILTAYIKWILCNSKRKNIKRLYFIARDGYILKEIADILIKKHSLDIETKYIYGSRMAWHAASITEEEMNNCDELADALISNGIPLRDVLKISSEDFKDNIDAKYIDDLVYYQDKDILLDILQNNKSFVSKIIENNREQRKLLIKYLHQEIDFSDNNYAFVDLAGSGKTNNRLARVISTFTDKKPKMFYFEIYKNCASGDLMHRMAYLFTEKRLCWAELLSRAPHGQTLGYEEKSGKVVPILENINLESFKDWDFDSYLEGIKFFAQNTELDIPIEIVSKYLFLIERNDPTIIGTFANEIFSCQCSNENQEFAPAFRKKDAINYLLFDKPFQTNAMHWSLHRTKPSIRKIIDFKNKYGSLRKFFIDIHFSNKDKEKLFYVQILGLKISLRSLIWRKNEFFEKDF